MSLTTQQFLANLGRGVSFKASATRKDGAQTRTIVLRGRPTDMTDEEFLHSARVDGIDGSVREKMEDNRTKGASGKEIYGDAAEALACDVLGIAPPAEESAKPKNRVKKNTLPVPSENHTAPADGVAAS